MPDVARKTPKGEFETKVLQASKIKNPYINICGACEALMKEVNNNELSDMMEDNTKLLSKLVEACKSAESAIDPFCRAWLATGNNLHNKKVDEGRRRGEVRGLLGRVRRRVAPEVGGGRGRGQEAPGRQEQLVVDRQRLGARVEAGGGGPNRWVRLGVCAQSGVRR